MRKLIKANNSRKDSVEAYACRCSCSCICTGSSKVTQAVNRSTIVIIQQYIQNISNYLDVY